MQRSVGVASKGKLAKNSYRRRRKSVRGKERNLGKGGRRDGAAKWRKGKACPRR